MRCRKANTDSAPQPHARNVLARDNGFAADIIGDVGEVDARQLVLLAGEHQPLIDRRVLHEAVMQDHPGDAGNDLDHLGAVFIRYVRGFLDQHRHQHHALVQYAVVLDELGEGQRHALGRGRKKHRRAGAAAHGIC